MGLTSHHHSHHKPGVDVDVHSNGKGQHDVHVDVNNSGNVNVGGHIPVGPGTVDVSVGHQHGGGSSIHVGGTWKW